MAEKICKAIDIGDGETVEFAPESGHQTPSPIIIRPDDHDVQWYWTPDDATPKP